MEVLLYSNRKVDPVIYDVSIPHKRDAAYLKLFNDLDTYWSCYEGCSPSDRLLVNRARKGDAKAAVILLDRRNSHGHEYETFQIIEVIDPEKENEQG